MAPSASDDDEFMDERLEEEQAAAHPLVRTKELPRGPATLRTAAGAVEAASKSAPVSPVAGASGSPLASRAQSVTQQARPHRSLLAGHQPDAASKPIQRASAKLAAAAAHPQPVAPGGAQGEVKASATLTKSLLDEDLTPYHRLVPPPPAIATPSKTPKATINLSATATRQGQAPVHELKITAPQCAVAMLAAAKKPAWAGSQGGSGGAAVLQVVEVSEVDEEMDHLRQLAAARRRVSQPTGDSNTAAAARSAPASSSASPGDAGFTRTPGYSPRHVGHALPAEPDGKLPVSVPLHVKVVMPREPQPTWLQRMFPRRWQRLDTGQGVQLASLDGGAPRRTPSDFGLEPEQPATVFHKGRAALVEGFSIAASTTADGFAVIANKANDLIHGGSGGAPTSGGTSSYMNVHVIDPHGTMAETQSLMDLEAGTERLRRQKALRRRWCWTACTLLVVVLCLGVVFVVVYAYQHDVPITEAGLLQLQDKPVTV